MREILLLAAPNYLSFCFFSYFLGSSKDSFDEMPTIGISNFGTISECWDNHCLVPSKPCLLFNFTILNNTLINSAETSTRVAILAFSRPNSSNLAFLKGVWLAKFRLAFWVFLKLNVSKTI